MPKAGELTYYQKIGEAQRRSAVAKPFSIGQADPAFTCGDYLIAFGGVCELLRPTPSRLLDLGCGTGWTSCFFAKMGYEVVGQDIAPDAIDMAIRHCEAERTTNVSFVANDYEALNFDGEFDNAVFFDSLHHAVDERAALESAFRALKPGGVCVTREPGVGHAEAEHSLHAIQQYGVTEKDMPPSRIAELAFEIGFRQVNVYPFPNDLFRIARGKYHLRMTRPLSGFRGWYHRMLAAIGTGLRIAKASRKIYARGGLVQLVK